MSQENTEALRRRPGFRLSKSSFLQGRQCPLRLWLRSRDVSEAPGDGDGYYEAAEDFAEQAQAVEVVAGRLFPGGVRVPNVNEGGSLDAAAVRTAVLLKDKSIPTLFQATFVQEDLVGVVDVIQRTGNGWILYEVKASSRPKPIFFWDLAFQWILLERYGLPIVQAKVLYLNQQYVYPGGDHVARDMLVDEDCTKQVQGILSDAATEIAQQLDLLDSATAPVESPGRRCRGHRDDKAGNRPSDCGHLDESGYCGKLLPANWSLRMHRITIAQTRGVIDQGLVQIGQLNDSDQGFGWSTVQTRIIRATRDGCPEVDRDALRNRLSLLEWPIAFIDFEYEPAVAVPPYPGMRPNQRLPFQWSLGVQRTKGESMKYAEPFLQTGSGDPRRPFIESLIESLPSSGSVATHFSGAEKGVLKLYREWFPGEYDAWITDVEGRLFDTCDLARETYYHPNMGCSFSLKRLAPALLSQGYDDLAIQDGMAAVRKWRELQEGSVDGTDLLALQTDLLAYCQRDTELMSGLLTAFFDLLTR